MAALPTTIYNSSSQPYADQVQLAWGAALLLVVFVLVLSIGSRLLAARLRKERR
jgi:ABC-type phosphate transport system permease subunit